MKEKLKQLSKDRSSQDLLSYPCVKILLEESLTSDPTGEDYKPLVTILKGKEFRKAKAILSKMNLFHYKGADNIWMVRNLQTPLSWRKTATDSRSYSEFLQSDYWLSVKKSILERDQHNCQKCGNKTNLHVHHLTYVNHGSEHENLNDLITICESCHDKEHKRKR